MSFFTKEQVKKAIQGGEAQGFSGDDVVNEMVAKGHQLEGLNAEERRTAGAFPIEQNKGGISQVGKQLYNVGNEAFQLGKAVVTKPHKLVAGVAGLAVGAGENLVEGVSSAVSTLGKGIGLDIPEIRIPQFHPDGTVSYEEKNKFEQMSELIGKQYGITSLASGNPKQAFKDVEKTLFEAPLSSALDVLSAGVAKSGKIPKLTRAADTAQEVTRPGILKTAAKGVGDELLQKSTGLGKENIQSIVRHPTLYSKADAGEITRGSIAHNVKSGIDTRLKEIGEAGRIYDDIRQSGVAVSVPKNGVQSVLKKYGLEFDDVNSRIKVGSESRPLSGSDIRELEEFFGQYGGEQLTANGFLNAREKLSQLSGFDVARTDVMNNLARDLRAHYNGVARPQVKGLKELDNAYAPEVGKLREIKKEYLRTVVDDTGQRVTVLKDNAISRIMGSTNKGREEILKRLDDISPGIGDEIRVLKALEDVQLATGNKIGSYARSGLGVMGVATLNLPMLAAAVLTSPAVIARILEWYGKMKGYDAADVMLKMKRTGKLAPDELGFVQDAVRAYEKASDSANPLKNPQGAILPKSKAQGLDSSPSTLPANSLGVNMADDFANLTPEEKATGLIGRSDSPKYKSALEAMDSPEMQAKWAKVNAAQKNSKVTKTSNNLYHTTSAENLQSIMDNGLTTGNKARFEGVSSPDKISFSANEAGANYYGKQGDVMIRTKTSYKPTDLELDLLAGGEGTYTTGKNIPADMLQVKQGSKWVDLKDYKSSSVVGGLEPIANEIVIKRFSDLASESKKMTLGEFVNKFEKAKFPKIVKDDLVKLGYGEQSKFSLEKVWTQMNQKMVSPDDLPF